MANPFESSQYRLSITSSEVFDSSTATLSGAQAIMSALRDAIVLRQEAIKAGYPSPVPFNNVELSNLNLDTPGGILNASYSLFDAVLQFLSGHSSGEYERLASKGCSPDAVEPFGFFQKFTSESGLQTPSDGYFYSILDVIDSDFKQEDIDNLLRPPVFGSEATPTIPLYVAAQGFWANSLIKILNKFIFIHKSLIWQTPVVSCLSSESNCAFNYSLSGFDVDPAWNDNPVEIILDVSEALVCANPSESGYLCLSFSSFVGRHRIVVLPTIDRNSPENTAVLRSSLFGFEYFDISGNPYGGGSGNTGYLDPQFYINNASQTVRFEGSADGIFCPVLPLADSSCVNTISQFPPFPWKKQGDVGKVCIPINSNHFSTVQEADDRWRYKLRVIVFPNCSPFFASSSQWNFSINCMDCSCDDVFCGGDDPPPPPGPPRSICTFNQTRSGPGQLTAHDYILLAPLDESQKICLRFRTNIGSFAPDRMYLLRTWYPSDHPVDEGYDSVQDMIGVVRSPIYGARDVDFSGQSAHQQTTTGYYNSSFYQSEATSNNFSHTTGSERHPYFSRPPAGQVGTARINCPSSAIMLDSGCVHSQLPPNFTPSDPAFSPIEWCYDNSSGSFVTCISIPANTYSNDINDPWYRRVRLVIFDDCDNIGVASWIASSDCIGPSCAPCPCDEFISSSSSSSSSSLDNTSSSSSSYLDETSSSSSSSSSSSFYQGDILCTQPPCSAISSCEDIPVGNSVDLSVLCYQCLGIQCPNNIIISEREWCTMLLNTGCIEFISGQCCLSSIGYPVNGNYIQYAPDPDCICNTGIEAICNDNCGQACLGIGSMITMADGSLREIEKLKVGDRIMSVDFGYLPSRTDLLEANSYIPPRNEWRYSYTTVKSVKFGFEREYYLVNNTLRATFEHPILVKDQEKILFRSASILKDTDRAYNEKLEEMKCEVAKVEKALATVRINTEPYDWYFANGILVHNDETISEFGLPISQTDGPDPGQISSSSVYKLVIG